MVVVAGAAGAATGVPLLDGTEAGTGIGTGSILMSDTTSKWSQTRLCRKTYLQDEGGDLSLFHMAVTYSVEAATNMPLVARNLQVALTIWHAASSANTPEASNTPGALQKQYNTRWTCGNAEDGSLQRAEKSTGKQPSELGRTRVGDQSPSTLLANFFHA